jgi:hypothetical protein
MDLFGPCKTSDMGNKYILTITDAFTKYSEIVAIPNKEAETVADAVFTKWICRYGCPAVIHTDGGKEFLNKIATELYQKLDIKSTHTAPAHPQCNSQAEVFNKSLAKFLKNVVDETTLNWEWYLAPLMFCYNTSYHSTTKSTPFELTYGMKPRLPTFPIPELQRISYGEGFVAERLQILRKARQIALDHSFEAATAYKDYHDQKASKHNLVEGDYAYIDNQLFLGKNKKLSQRWIGPYLVTKVINDQNVELQMSPKRVQVHSAYRLKKFIDPKASKFLDKERNKKEMTTGQETEFNPKNLSPENRKHLNEEIKSKIEKRITRSMTNQSKNEQAIAVINNLIIPDSEKLKLKTIAKKIYQSSRLTEEEASFWNSFPNSEKSYILTGDSASTLDFTEYQKATFCSEQQNNQGQNQEDNEQQNLFFEPSSSDTDSSDDSDYIQPIPLRRIISNTDDSWPDNSGSNLFNQPSTSTQQPKQQDNLDLDRNSSTDSSEIDLSPKVTTKNKPTKSIVDSWKNTAQSLWKPSSKIKINPDPVAISTRTRSKAGENEPEQLVSHPHDLNIDAMCSDKSEQRRAKSPSGFQKNWPLRNQCALPSHQDSCKPFTNH